MFKLQLQALYMIIGTAMSIRSSKARALVLCVVLLAVWFPITSASANTLDIGSRYGLESDFYTNVTQERDSLPISDEEIEALLKEFWNATGGPNWHPITWDFRDQWDTWPGVELYPGNAMLVQLLANNLNGTIPPSFAKLPLAYLSLNGNHLSGTIPDTFCNTIELSSLLLSNNLLEGSIPHCLGLANTNLSSISMASNRLNGTIPESIFNAVDLVYLVLNGNQLEGTLSDGFGNLTNLISMDLSNNKLSGTLPAALNRMTKLTQILLANNRLEGNLTRELLRPWLTISKLILSGNQFTGSLYYLSYLTNVTVVSVSHNLLTEPLPLFRLMSKLTYFDISYNQVNGALDPTDLQLFTVSDLAYLNLMGNNLRPIDDTKLKQYPLSFSGDTQFKTSTEDWTCKTISTREQGLTLLLDPSFLNYSHCACIRGYYGVPPHDCYPCPTPTPGYCLEGTTLKVPRNSYPYPIRSESDEEEEEAELLEPSQIALSVASFSEEMLETPKVAPIAPPFVLAPTAGHPQHQPVYLERCVSSLACSNLCVIELVPDGNSSLPYIPRLIPAPGEPEDAKCGCTDGHSGRMCSKCICDPNRPGGPVCYYEAASHCRKCNVIWSSKQTTIFGSCIALLLLVIATVIHALMLRSKRSFRSNKDSMGILKRALYRILHVRAVGYFKIVIIWLQTLSAIISWRFGSLQQLSSLIDIFNGNAGGIGATCLWTALRFRSVAYAARALLPIALIILLFLSIFIAHIIWNFFFRPKSQPYSSVRATQSDTSNLLDEPSNSSDSDSESLMRSQPNDTAHFPSVIALKSGVSESDVDDSHFHMSSRASEEQLNLITREIANEKGVRFFSARSMAVSELITVLYFFYFGVTLSSLAYFTCQKQVGTGLYYLESFPWLRCDTKEVQMMRFATIPVLILYTAGVPAGFFGILYFYRNKIHLRPVNDIIGGLYRCYRSPCYMWDLAVLLRRLLLAIALRIPENSVFHRWTVTLVLIIALGCQFWFQPFHRKGENRAEEASLILLIISYVAQTDPLSVTLYKDSHALFYFSALINIVYLIFILVMIIRAWFTTPLTFSEEDEAYSDADNTPALKEGK